MVLSVSVGVVGGGPAGSAAAIAALSEARSVHIFEKSGFPRHKVCGEFLSPEIAPLLESLGIWQEFLRLRPAHIKRTILHFGARSSESQLPDGAFGLSRYEFDRLLFEKAIALGATTARERMTAANAAAQAGANSRDCQVLATGRKSIAAAGRRLFGFKAHFEGPVNDAVELFFFRGCYVGVSAIENGITNICGIAPEHVLRACEFQIDDLLSGWPPLACRVRPLSRVSRWFTVGPLVFGGQWQHFAGRDIYPAGDALGFIDPFTGSGLGKRSRYRSYGWIGCFPREFGRGLPVQLSPCSPQTFLSGHSLPGDSGSGTGAESGPADSCPLPLSDDAARRSHGIESRMSEVNEAFV